MHYHVFQKYVVAVFISLFTAVLNGGVLPRWSHSRSVAWAVPERVAGLGMRNGTSKSPLRPRPRDELLKARGTSCVRHGAALRAAPWLPQ